MTFVKLHRDADAAGGGGGALPPSLSDIMPDDGNFTQPDISNGDGNKTPEDLAKAKAEADAAAAAAGKADPPAGETAEEKAAREKAEAEEAGEGDDDKDDEAGEGKDDEGEETPEAFFEAVHNITGEPLKVEYGDVDPLSPEGIAMYTQAVRQDEVVKFENHLKTSDPRAYAYFLHRENGGDDESFFANKTVAIPDETAFKASVDMQTNIYRKSLIDRGIDADIADAQVAKAIKDNVLLEKATAVYESTKAAQAKQLADMQAQAKSDQDAFNQKCATIVKSLDTTIDKGTMKFIVPDAKKAEFKAFVKDSLRVEGDKFYAVQELGDSPEGVLESLYFKYIKGDLTGMVEKRAGTKTVQRLKLHVKKAQNALPAGSKSEKSNNDFVPLGSI